MKNQDKKGFTIIELMLSMVFLGTLLVAIAILTIHIMGIYQKGLSIRSVSSMGRQLIDDFSRTVGGSPIVPVNPVDLNNDKILQSNEISAAQANYFFSKSSNGVQRNGAFCTGSYTYIWNTAETYKNTSTSLKLRYTDADGNEVNDFSDFKLIRIPDQDRQVCKEYQSNGGSSTIDARGQNMTPIELINSDEADLILYDFTVFPATQNTITGQTFYSATFILATIEGGVNIMDNGNFCGNDSNGQPSDYSHRTDFSYCAINKFNFAMRATGYTDAEDDGQYGNR